MPFDIVMPKMGESVEEATITKWFVKENDQVEEDEGGVGQPVPGALDQAEQPGLVLRLASRGARFAHRPLSPGRLISVLRQALPVERRRGNPPGMCARRAGGRQGRSGAYIAR